MDTNDIIAARRKHIQDSAPCEGCGETLANCEAARGQDPTAPEWFGCCAQGLNFVPCRHFPDQEALLTLLREVESGHVRTVEQVTPKPQPKVMSFLDYLNQSERWKPNGQPMVRVADMDPEWRHNAAAWLERRAAVFADRYTLDERLRFVAMCSSPAGPSDASQDGIERDIETRADQRGRDPVAWIRSTALYRALTADLPTGEQGEQLAVRARHWSTCPVRTGTGDECRCEQIALADAERYQATPEWTI